MSKSKSKSNSASGKTAAAAAAAPSRPSFNQKDEQKYSMGKINGKLFRVPETHDMVNSLFDPSISKSVSDYIIVLILFTYGLIYFITPESQRTLLFIGLYLFWRLGYNAGIGIMLYTQSNYNYLYDLFMKYKDNDKSQFGKLASKFIQLELKTRLSEKELDEVPDEFKTWIIFRAVVNLILMSDFTTYMFMVFSCAKNSFNQSWPLVVLRMTFGIGLFLFNLIVKLDAHKIVKDYAWYWGDFFFRLHNNEDLIFDGVFDLAPHPMYSIGYAGYYGFALMTKSYTVLIMSIVGHVLQIVFLNIVENPHIDKIYGGNDESKIDIKNRDFELFKDEGVPPMVIFKNFNYLRATDYFPIFSIVVTGIMPIFFPYSKKWNVWFICFTIGTKIVGSLIINTILYHQSRFTSWTRHFMNVSSADMNVLDNIRKIEILTFKNWSVLYNNITIMTYSTLFATAIREFISNGFGNNSNWILLRIIIAITALCFQYAINIQILDSIGVFGWLYGDFYMIMKDSKKKYIRNLTRSGIYRYLNNPERFSTLLTVWGLAILFASNTWFITMGIIWTLNNFILLNFIEKPHMIDIYGETDVMNYQSGIERSVNQLFIPSKMQGSIIKISDSIDKVITSSSKKVDTYIKNRRRSSNIEQEAVLKFIESNNNVINKKETFVTLEEEEDIEGDDNADKPILLKKIKNSSINLLNKKFDTERNISYYYIGESIELEWNSLNTTNESWIGLYNLMHVSSSRFQTLISSKDHWTPIHKLDASVASYDYLKKLKESNDAIVSDEGTSGVVKFSHDLNYYEPGVYEFRFYFTCNHEVFEISEPFELRVPELSVPLVDEEENLGKSDVRVAQLSSQIFQGLLLPLFKEGDKSVIIDENNINFSKMNKKKMDTFTKLLTVASGLSIKESSFLNERDCAVLAIKIIRMKNIFHD